MGLSLRPGVWVGRNPPFNEAFEGPPLVSSLATMGSILEDMMDDTCATGEGRGSRKDIWKRVRSGVLCCGGWEGALI